MNDFALNFYLKVDALGLWNWEWCEGGRFHKRFHLHVVGLVVENMKLFSKQRGSQWIVRNYTLKTIISIIVVFKFYYFYLTRPLELVTDTLGNIFIFQKKNWRFDVINGLIYIVLWFSMFPQVISYYQLFYLNIIVIYIVKLKMFINRKMFIIIVVFIHWDKLSQTIFF